MKLSLKLAALIIAFCALLLPFAKPQTANAQGTGCQLIVSTTSVVAHGSFNVTVQNGVSGTEYAVNYDSSFFRTVFIMPASGSFTATVNLDQIFGPSSPQASSGSFLVTAGTTAPLGLGGGACDPTAGILITVIAPPPPTATITAASTNIAYNTSTTLTWTSTNADTCTLNGSSVPTNGSQPTGNLTTTTTFTLSCTNVSGTATASVTVNVQPPPAPTCSPPTQSVNTGANANFTASAGTGTYSWSAPGGSPSSGNGGSFSTSYSTAGTKTVTVTSGSQNASCSVNVTTPPPTADIKANGSDGPISIAFNTTATLTWQSTNATSCSVSPGGYGGTSSTGQTTANLTVSTSYTLTCNGASGSKTDTVTINVNAPLDCSYTFTPTTVDSDATITVTITAGGSLDNFSAAIADTPPGTNVYNKQVRTGLGTITLKAPTVSTATQMVVAAADESVSPAKLCGGSSAITVNPPPSKWSLSDIVASNQLSVLFSFTPTSNGYIGLVVTNTSTGSVAFDSGPIANGTSNVTWNFPPPGSYSAVLIYGLNEVSNRQPFTVNPAAGNTWQLSVNNTNGYLVVFNISPNAGGNSALLIMDSTKTNTIANLPIPLGANSMTWTGPTTASPTTYEAVINYYILNVSNWAQFTLPVNPPATQWTLSIQSINGNDITFNVQCPTKDCPGYGGQAVVAIKDLSGLSQPVPAGGGTVTFTGLPNGSHQAVVVVFLSEESGVVNFTLPQKTSCGWLAFPGGAGIVKGPVNNCALASPGGIISAFLPYVFGIAGFLSIIIIVISGIQFITSSGNPEAAASARNRLIFALIGLAIIILAFAILQIVDKLFLGGSGVS